MQIKYSKLLDILEKGGKRAQLGEVRTWRNGAKFMKTSDGWVYVGGKHRGKLLGKTKGPTTHLEHVAHLESKPEKKEQKREFKVVPHPTESGSWTYQKPDGSIATGTSYSDEEIAQKEVKRIEELDFLEQNPHKMNKKEWVKKRLDLDGISPRNRKAAQTAGLIYEARVAALENEGKIKRQVAPEFNTDAQAKTNMIGRVDFSSVSKKMRAELTTMLKDANTLMADIGITFKKPINFATKGKLTSAKRTRGSHNAATNTISLMDASSVKTTVMHEIGHAVDYAMQDKNTVARGPQKSEGRSAEMNTEGMDTKYRAAALENPELAAKYQELQDFITKSDHYQSKKESNKSFYKYIAEPTEVFARAFEVYSYTKARKLADEGKISKDFAVDFLPNIYETKNPAHTEYQKSYDQYVAAYETIRKEAREIFPGDLGQDYIKREDFRREKIKPLKDKMEKAREDAKPFYTLVSLEKRENYEAKITEMMEFILKNDQIRKALAMTTLSELLAKALTSPETNTEQELLGILEKASGEGSRGGKVVGHTKEGKPIYESQKKRIKGKLTTDDQWNVIRSTHAKNESAHGDDGGHSCEHCDKAIKQLVFMDHPDHGEVKVGRDCAEALAEGSAQKRLDDHFDAKKKEEKTKKDEEKQKLKDNIEANHYELTRKVGKKEVKKAFEDAIMQAAHHSDDGGTLMNGNIERSQLDFKTISKILKEAVTLHYKNAKPSKFSEKPKLPEWAESSFLEADYVPHLPAAIIKVASKLKKSAYLELHGILLKSKGEGSRGGKVIGHTRSGKPIYDQSHRGTSSRGWSVEDHVDAHQAHKKLSFEALKTDKGSSHPKYKKHKKAASHHKELVEAVGGSVKSTEKPSGTFHADDLPKGVDIPKHHKVVYNDDDELDEHGFNYRLENAEDIHYAVKDGKVIGHMGVSEDDDGNPKIGSVHVDDDHQRKGVASSLYHHAADHHGEIHSDDADAMEPGAKKLWAKLQGTHNVEKKEDGGFKMTSSKVKKSLVDNPNAGIAINTAEQSLDEMASRGSDHWIAAIENCVKDADYGSEPCTLPLPKFKKLYISKVDDGLYSAFLKNEDPESGDMGQVLTRMTKMTPESMVQAMKAKGYLPKTAETPEPDHLAILNKEPSQELDKYAKLKEILKEFVKPEIHIHLKD